MGKQGNDRVSPWRYYHHRPAPSLPLNLAVARAGEVQHTPDVQHAEHSALPPRLHEVPANEVHTHERLQPRDVLPSSGFPGCTHCRRCSLPALRALDTHFQKFVDINSFRGEEESGRIKRTRRRGHPRRAGRGRAESPRAGRPWRSSLPTRYCRRSRCRFHRCRHRCRRRRRAPPARRPAGPPRSWICRGCVSPGAPRSASGPPSLQPPRPRSRACPPAGARGSGATRGTAPGAATTTRWRTTAPDRSSHPWRLRGAPGKQKHIQDVTA